MPKEDGRVREGPGGEVHPLAVGGLDPVAQRCTARTLRSS
jgi:hypothetical protein